MLYPRKTKVEDLNHIELLDAQHLWLYNLHKLLKAPVDEREKLAEKLIHPSDGDYAALVDKEVDRRQKLLIVPLQENPNLEPTEEQAAFIIPFREHVMRMREIAESMVALSTTGEVVPLSE